MQHKDKKDTYLCIVVKMFLQYKNNTIMNTMMETQKLSNWGVKSEKHIPVSRKERKDIHDFNFVRDEVTKMEQIFGRYSEKNNVPFEDVLFDD